MNNFLYGPQKIDTFIEFHNMHHIHYCEAIIYSNSDIEYCIPSHQESLIRAIGITKEELMNKISSCDELMTELCNLSKCIAVWYDFYINPNAITEEQYQSLVKLRNNNCIDSTLLLTKESGYQMDKGVRKYYN